MIRNFFYRQLHRISVWLLAVSWVVLGIINGEIAKLAENPVAGALSWPMGTEFFIRIWVALSVALLVSSEFNSESLKCVIVSGRKRKSFFFSELFSTVILASLFIIVGYGVGFLCSKGLYAQAFGTSYFLYELEMFVIHFCIIAVCFAIGVSVKNKLLAALIGPVVIYAEMFVDHILKTEFFEFYANSPAKDYMLTGIAKRSFDLAFLGKADIRFFLGVVLVSTIISAVAVIFALYRFEKEEC